MRTGFGAPDAQALRAPVDVVQPQTTDFTRAQAISCQQLKDSIVSQPHWRPVCPGELQNCFDLISAQYGWDTLICIQPRGNNVWGEIDRSVSRLVKILQQ